MAARLDPLSFAESGIVQRSGPDEQCGEGAGDRVYICGRSDGGVGVRDLYVEERVDSEEEWEGFRCGYGAGGGLCGADCGAVFEFWLQGMFPEYVGGRVDGDFFADDEVQYQAIVHDRNRSQEAFLANQTAYAMHREDL